MSEPTQLTATARCRTIRPSPEEFEEGAAVGNNEPRRFTAVSARAMTVVLATTAIGFGLWRFHPPMQAATDGPDADIVLGCEWLAWALAGYLALAAAATATAHLLAHGSRLAHGLRRLAPVRLRRLVDAAVTAGVTTALVASTAAAPALAAPAAPTVRPPIVAGSPLDWPGLVVARLSHAPTAHHTNNAADSARHLTPARRPGGEPSTEQVVVRAGDTLWSIAAAHLDAGASPAAIAAAWHEWYAANRAAIGPDPGLIHPGQRLVAPEPPAAR